MLSTQVHGPRSKCSSVQHAVFTVENLADHLPSSTSRWSKVGRHGHAWLRQRGASRRWLTPVPAPYYSFDSSWQPAWRRALPLLDSTCSMARFNGRAPLPEARWWEAVNPFPPTCTVGGPAMDPASRPALQRSICQWSLPQHVVWMPMCLGRLHSASHVDDLHCRIRRRLRLYSTAAYRLEALCELRLMGCTRVCVLVALSARSCEVAPVIA